MGYSSGEVGEGVLNMVWEIDRTQKAIGVVNTAPVYQPLSGFERYDLSRWLCVLGRTL